MEFVDPFGWHSVDAARLRYIQERLGQFERMTWNEILIQGKKQNHSIPISRLCKLAQDRLAVLLGGNIDIDELVSLRFTGKERVWGIRDQAILSLLWWDPDHALCPTLLKNT